MLTSNILNSVIKTIVEHQIMMIGPLALEQANKVTGVKITDGENLNVTINRNDSNKILSELVQNYEKLFGGASVAVCKDAVKEIHPPIPDQDLPEILR